MCSSNEHRVNTLERNRVLYGEDQESYLDGMTQEGFLEDKEKPVMGTVKW